MRSTKPAIASNSSGWPIAACARGARRVEYFAGPSVPQPEYEGVMRNYAPMNCGARFTLCRPNERPILDLEMWSRSEQLGRMGRRPCQEGP